MTRPTLPHGHSCQPTPSGPSYIHVHLDGPLVCEIFPTLDHTSRHWGLIQRGSASNVAYDSVAADIQRGTCFKFRVYHARGLPKELCLQSRIRSSTDSSPSSDVTMVPTLRVALHDLLAASQLQRCSTASGTGILILIHGQCLQYRTL
ncbi:hypothetical protein Hypma_012549 [Hypsizygus marmoreus]|uniref:Uncharacterized protein n=1 Tax=Hypsizygus marmoreus TaxID=39966 RepID=A0A369JNN3_HYPMA|nr:hypothetical protein Hypma_012549 [Hypsizygus marmoreus]